MLKRLFLPFVVLLGVGGCTNFSDKPDVAWGQAQSAYNEAKRQAIALRRPCVDSVQKENHPNCLLKAESYPYVSSAIKRGDAIVETWQGQTPSNDLIIRGLLDVAAEIVSLLPVTTTQ